MSDKGKGILRRVTLLEPGDKSDDIYDDWAEDYDIDLLEQYGYIARWLQPLICLCFGNDGQ